ncbi:hypothetical protein [Crinalium epipsammum]|uniref:hypothetical protein n=1 Tax=Crinalium epipsammum TaxID=241425 RepID=UPI0002D7357A|nr:hypothetical protein [Crinalium epipsammum]
MGDTRASASLFTAKGSKTCVVRLAVSLRTEFQNHRTADAGNDEPIFCSRKGKGKGFLSREYLTNLVKKAAKRWCK